MQFIISALAVAGLLSNSVAATPAGRRDPNACSVDKYGPCTCPNGTQYSESVTTTVIGASAADVAGLVNDFFHPDWLGAAPYDTKGKDNTVGAVRTTLFPTPIGVYNISEKLLEYKNASSGYFKQVFEQLQSTIPVEYHSGNGSFSGYWVTLEGFPIFQYETLIRWSIYACETGHARNFAKFHEGALKNATNILTQQGKVLGVNDPPTSAQNF